jgi:murein tripeptide amidase MpaA
MHVSAQFDSGNIDVLDASDPSDVRLAIRPDVGGEHLQWFHFRIVGARGVPCTLRIVNADKASYPQGWPGYQACVSADRRAWRRVPTAYADGELRISLTPTHDVVFVAYFAPYSQERHLDLLARAAQSPRCRHAVLGWTVDGRDLDHLRVGEPGEDRRVVWIVARQHPGESMAEWFVEGLLERLLDPSCALARWLLDRAVFHVIPNMNPDGSSRGHLRTNAAGVNLNRAWHAPDLDRSPEVKLVRDAMDATGVDLCLDIHGDEAIPYNFAAGAEGIVGYTERLAALSERFCAAWESANPDFQRRYGYPTDPPGAADMSMCTNQVAARFDALSLTVEMPFKDNADAPDPVRGWSPERSARLGASVLDPIAAVVDALR